MRLPSAIHFLLAACLSLSAALSARGPAERILDYHSDITLEDDGSLEVTETITVNSTGQQISNVIAVWIGMATSSWSKRNNTPSLAM